jgi:hypothetical protein
VIRPRAVDKNNYRNKGLREICWYVDSVERGALILDGVEESRHLWCMRAIEHIHIGKRVFILAAGTLLSDEEGS